MSEEKNAFIIDPIHIRVGIIMFLAVVLFGVIAIQLWIVQISNNSEYNEKISRQSARQIRIPPVRGRILASDESTVLAGNRVSYDIQFHLSEMHLTRKGVAEQVMREAERVAECIGRQNPLNTEKIRRHLNVYPGIPMLIFKDLSNIELARITEIVPEVTGMEITAEPVRTYPLHTLAAHLIGYVGSSDPQTAEDRYDYFYYIPDLIGRSGIEKEFDKMLRGSPGKKLVLVNSRGFVHKTIENPVPARNGHDVILTLDVSAQRIAEQLLVGKMGAIVVMDASNGAIIAMASAPTYDLDEFIPRISREKYNEILDNPGKPFVNRAIMGAYMPGSIIKPIAALAFLENGLSTSEAIDCDGGTKVGNITIRCSSRYGHGPLAVEEAIQRSCNDFFIEYALKIGIDKISAVFDSAGLGKSTGFELSERSGLLPKNNSSWSRVDTALVSIGQGKINLSPLQAVTYISAIANGGTMWRPYLIDKIVDGNGNVVSQATPSSNGKLLASKQSIDIVSSGMYLAVNASNGSARNAKNSKIELHGKTGTAEVGPQNARYKNTWFTGFGVDTASQKTYSIIVLVEHGNSGGGTSAPLAKEFFERWLKK